MQPLITSSKPHHSNAFLKSLSAALTKPKIKQTSSPLSKDASSSSHEENRKHNSKQETPQKARGKQIYSSSSSDDDFSSSSSQDQYRSIAKPKLFTPSKSSIRSGAQRAMRIRVQEIKDQQIPTYELLASTKKVGGTSVTHQIIIVDQKFKPENLKINQGDAVEWKLCIDTISADDQSLYYERSRSHVISFDEVGFESPLLRISNRGTADPTKTTFRITFREAGSFEFVCRIYTWMKGKVEVQCTIDPEELSESEEEKSHQNLIQAAINSDKIEADTRESPIIDFKEIFEQYGDKMRPEDVIKTIVDEEKIILITPGIEEIAIDSRQIEDEEDKFLAEQRQSKRSAIRNSSGSIENPSGGDATDTVTTEEQKKPSTSRKRQFDLTGQLSPPKEPVRPVTDDERVRNGPRPIFNPNQQQRHQKEYIPPNNSKMNQFSLMFHSSSNTTPQSNQKGGSQDHIQMPPYTKFARNTRYDNYHPHQMIAGDTSSQYSQSQELESATSESSAMDNTSEQLNNSGMGGNNMYRYSKNPFAHLATASWQPFQHHELQQIFTDGIMNELQDQDDQRHQKLHETQARKKLKKKQYQKRKSAQRNDFAKPCDFDLMFMAAFACERQKRDNQSRVLDAYNDDYDNVQSFGGSPQPQDPLQEGLVFPMCGLQALLVSERDQFHLQTATDRIRTSFDQSVRGALQF